VARPHALTPLEVERIRAQLARPIDAALVSILAYAGLRPEEALPLQWRDVGHTIVVSRTWTHGELRERTKTGRIRGRRGGRAAVGRPRGDPAEGGRA
jgi:integrase